MGVAFLSAMRSKDPSTQVGACLVDTENKIVGIGMLVGREGGREGYMKGKKLFGRNVCTSTSFHAFISPTVCVIYLAQRNCPSLPSLLHDSHTLTLTGYNGFPRGCSDDALPWARHGEGGFLDTKYAYVCHAEMNAILNRNIAPLHGRRGRDGGREGGELEGR